MNLAIKAKEYEGDEGQRLAMGRNRRSRSGHRSSRDGWHESAEVGSDASSLLKGTLHVY